VKLACGGCAMGDVLRFMSWWGAKEFWARKDSGFALALVTVSDFFMHHNVANIPPTAGPTEQGSVAQKRKAAGAKANPHPVAYADPSHTLKRARM
jgi:hypothetical protein